ncbi:MAG: YraN family protein [Emcibacteraceae bacterium]|nr:YraN family protein [Emcibacteraceae bacterium]MDG1996327.1 YraN family protein [Emcibacteraceae bacterium]
MDKRKKAYKRGHFAEQLAAIFLMLKGYTIVARRYKTKVGEIDLIAKKKNVTIFCEVKARKTTEIALESLSHKQKMRIRNAAEYYMAHLNNKSSNNMIENEIFRCDMMLVVPWRLPVHIENAW